MNLDVFKEFNKSILLAFNGGDNLFIDYFVLIMTSAFIWVPLCASLLYLVMGNNEDWQKIILAIEAVALGFFVANDLSLSIVKPLVARPRPLNNPDLQGIVVAVNHCMTDGYGFFSSHTANAFVIIILFCLLVRDRIFSILVTE